MKTIQRRIFTASLMSCIALASIVAHADGAGSAEAEELFKQGRAALEAKDYATACTKLAESNRLERAVGTLISLAQCEEGQNKLAAARSHWQEAADFADAIQDRLQRGAPAREKFKELDKRVARLTVRPLATAPHEMSVKRDDVTLTSASFGSALPVDPGKHVLVVSAESHEPKTYEIVLAEGEAKEIEIEPGAAIAKPPPPPAATTQSPSPPPQPPPPLPPEDSGKNMRYAAYGLGGVGVLGLGLGTAFGLVATSQWNGAQSDCKPNDCGSKAQSETGDARTSATVSTVSFVVGGVALAGGVALWLLAPSPSSPSAPSVGVVPTPYGAAAAGSF